MDFHLSNEQLMLRKMYREFAENEVKPLAEEVDETEEFPMEMVTPIRHTAIAPVGMSRQASGYCSLQGWQLGNIVHFRSWGTLAPPSPRKASQ